MVHLRIIAPREEADRAIALLKRAGTVTALVVYRGAAVQPEGDVVSCDVADEEASFIVGDLRQMGISECGVIDVDHLDASVSTRGLEATRLARGNPADAVVWHAVGERIAQQGFLSWGLVALFTLAGAIASVAVLIDSAPIVVGAMAVSPDFGPIAAFSVGVIRRRRDIALGGFAALTVGFTAAIVAGFAITELLMLTGVAPDDFNRAGNALAQAIAAPDGYSVVVALCAGAAGMLSVALGKSGALVGVAISITTIPAAADIGLSAAYGDWSSVQGSGWQLFYNIMGLLVSATLVLALMRSTTARRGRRHRAELGLDAPPRRGAPADDPLGAHLQLDGEAVGLVEDDLGIPGATPPSPATPTPRASSAPD
jgi:uncharacterized hydrophobic protein (TIGR00271 family)